MNEQFLKDITTGNPALVIVDSSCIGEIQNTLLSDTLNELKKREIEYEISDDLLGTVTESIKNYKIKKIYIVSESTQYRSKIAKLTGKRVDFYSPLNLKKVRDKRKFTYVAFGVAILILTMISINNYDIKRMLQSEEGLIKLKYQIGLEKNVDKKKETEEKSLLKYEKNQLKAKVQRSESIYEKQQQQARTNTERKIQNIINNTERKLLINRDLFYKEMFSASSVTNISKLYIEDFYNKKVHKKSTDLGRGKINSLTEKYFISIMLEGERQIKKEINLYQGSTKARLFNRSVDVIGEVNEFNTQKYTTISTVTYMIDTTMLESSIKKNINTRVALIPLSIFDIAELPRAISAIKITSNYLVNLIGKRVATGGMMATADGGLPFGDFFGAGIVAWTMYEIKEAFFDFRSELERKLEEDISRYTDQSRRERISNLDSIDENFSKLNIEMTNKSLAKLGV